MKILVFSSYFYPHKGGSEKYVYEIYRRLIKNKIKVDIFTSNTEGSLEYENIKGLRIYRVPCYNILGDTYPIPKPINSFKLLKKLAKNNYDFVNTQTRFWISSFYGYLFSKLTKTKLIHTEHGSRHTEFNNLLLKFFGAIYDHLIGSIIIKSASKNIGVSQASCDFAKHLGAKKTYLVPNGINITKFKIKKTNLKRKLGIPNYYKIITFIGRLIYAKGIQDLIYVFQKIKKKYPKTKLLIVGEGNYKNELRKLSNNEDIMFLGQRSENDIVDILNITDIFVNPSYSEGLPTSVLEAAAVGVPIIATDVGGTKEIIKNNKRNILIKPNKKDLLNSIFRILKNNRFNKKIMNENFPYDWTKIKKKFIRYLK